MLLDDPPQSRRSIHDRYGRHEVVDGLIDLAATGRRHAADARSLIAHLCDPEDLSSSAYGSLFKRFYVDAERWAERKRGRLGGHSVEKRIAIYSEMTRHGNISVKVVQQAYLGFGRWTWADEWRRDHPIGSFPSGFMERPTNELLFFRGACDLVGHDPYVGRNAEDHEYRRLSAMAVTSQFWAAIGRLSRHFDVAIISYPETIESPRPGAPTLRVVDAVAEHKDLVRRGLADFEKDYGHPPDRLWHICDEERRAKPWQYRDRAARKLNKVGTKRLVPTAAEAGYELLKTAAGYGLFRPAQAPPEPPPPPAKPAPRPPRVPEPPSVSGRKVDAPSYRGRRAAPLPAETAAELGVVDTVDLVEKLNSIWARRGEAPLPEGDYPSTKSSLARVLKMYRKEIEPDPDPSAGPALRKP